MSGSLNLSLITHCLASHREPHQVRTHTESSALASRISNARGHYVQDSEHRRRDNRQAEDVLNRERALRDEDGRNGDEETLYEVLDAAIYDFSCGVHYTISKENSAYPRSAYFHLNYKSFLIVEDGN